MNGKDIILQRLRNNKNIKKFRFLGNELRNQIFDLLANKYQYYRKNDLSFIFPTIKLNKTLNDINKGNKPSWMSQNSFNYLIKIKANKSKFDETLKELMIKWDEKTAKYFANFVNFYDEMNDAIQTKGQNPLYIVNYLISGKLEDGTEFRAPFAFNEIEDLKINHQTGEVDIIPTDKIIINVPFVSWIGNKFNYDTEKLIRNIQSSTTKDDYISEFLQIYKKIKIDIDKQYFDDIKPNELKLCRENIEIKDAKKVAEHESVHLVCALHYGFDVDTIDINKQDNVMGQVLITADSDDVNLENLITITIAPYIKVDNISYKYVSDHLEITDFDDICKNLDRLSSDLKQKAIIFDRCLLNAKQIVKKYEKEIQLFSEIVFNKKTLMNDEILAIWDGESIETNNSNNELKFEENKFVVEEVRLLALCPEISEMDIFKDVEEIFENTKFIENLLDSDFNKKPTKKMDESKIAWGFNADFSQQKAVYDTLLNDNSIIQGPPGTGKTQTILNIISNALANNQKVLVVTEKTTAVDVINDRIKENAPELSSFVLDLYNVNKLGIEFYNQLGKKVEHVHYSKSLRGNYISANSLQQKVDKISTIGQKIDKINLISLYNKAQDIKVLNNDIDLKNSLVTKNISSLTAYSEDKIDEICEWKNKNNEFIAFRESYFAQNIPEVRIKSLYDLNMADPYNDVNSYKFSSLLIRNKPKANIFIRKKYRKLAKRLKLDILFHEDFKKFTEYLNFNFNLFEKKDFNAISDLEKIKKAESCLDRVIEVDNFLASKVEYENIVSLINTTNILKFEDLNSKSNFIELHKQIYWSLRNKIFNFNTLRQFTNDIKEIEECATRQKMTKVVKAMIFEHWKFLYNFFPIVLTTPELLSHYIPNTKDLYDIVVIDEASQFLIEKSIPALYRGKKRIISGDNQQLRPKIDTRFSSTDWHSDEKVKFHQLVESESILDLFEKLFGASGTMLTTHYRSEKNELIKFSNENFYDGKLNFIEQAKCLNKKSAIEVIDVNGKWIDQSNQEEADEIISQLVDIYKENGSASVGVIVFSKKQATLIKKTLLKSISQKVNNVIKSFRSNEPNTLFIKSIDEVQGEERDIIIFGITYGNNVHNYMLLSDEYAKNKINVAVTRAKQKIIIIKSHKSNEYRRLNNHNEFSGSEVLFKFLAYAEDSSKIKNKSNDDDLSTIDKDIISYIAKNGSDVEKIITIHDKKFFVVDNNPMKIYFLVDERSMNDARNDIWFYESLINSRGYDCHPILITDLYKI